MTPTITAKQRDALSEQILIRLSAIDSIPLAVEAGDLETAERLAREHSDYLSLMLDDLGFGADSGEVVELRSPPDLLRRVSERLLDLAKAQGAVEEQECSEAKRSREQNRLLSATCSSVLSGLDAG